MKEKTLNKALKLVWRTNFTALTGYKKWMVTLETMHPSYRYLFAFYLLNPKQLTRRVTERIRRAYFKKQGDALIRQMEESFSPPFIETRIQVYDTMVLLDHFLLIKESNCIAPISNPQLAALILSNFNIELAEVTLINYLSRNRGV